MVLCGAILAIERPINYIASMACVKFPDEASVTELLSSSSSCD